MNKVFFFKVGSYATVLCGFVLMFFLYIPSFDVFYFSRDYESNLLSFWENSLFYGNGRLLGNLIGISVSHNFKFAFIIVAVSLSLVVFLINQLVFDNDYRFVFPIAVAVAFPCKGIFSEVYSVYASFTNYVLPIIFLLSAWCILKNRRNYFACVPIFFMSFLACLFSENTTIVVLVSAILYLIHSIVESKKLTFRNLSFFSGALLGSLAMYLIPKVTNTSEKLSYYREIKTELFSLIKSVISVSFSFSNMFSSFWIPILICSLSLSFLIYKQSKIHKKLKTSIVCYLLFFAAESFTFATFSDDSLLSIYFAALQTVAVILYAIFVFIALLCLNKSTFSLLLLELYVLVLFSIAPLLVVSKYGYRTFYLTFILLIVFACSLIKHIAKMLLANTKTKTIQLRIVPVTFSIIFIFLSINTFMQTSYNYNFYVERTQYIAEQVNAGADMINVPTLPCKALTCEDEHPSSLGDIIYKSNFKSYISVQALANSDNANDYNSVLSRNPISSVLFSLSHLEYNSPSVIFSLTENES